MGGATPIGVGLVGYGLAGRFFHGPFIDACDGLELRAIVTSDPDRAGHAAREHPAARVVGILDEVLARSDVDLIVVAAPNRFHAPMAMRALGAGRHVVVDKPMAMDVAEAESLIAAAAAAGRLLSVFQNRRWDGDFLTIRGLIDDGALGPIDSFESRFERWSPVADEWRETAAEAAGPLRDLGAHLVDQSRVLFGPVRRVWAQTDCRRPGTQVEDSIFVALDHTNGVRSRLWMSMIAAGTGPRMRLRGLNGEYIKHGLDVQEPQLVGGMLPTAAHFGEEPRDGWGTLFQGGGSPRVVPSRPGQYGRFYELLRDAIRDDGEPPVEPLDSMRVLGILDAASRAAATGVAEVLADG